MASFRSVISIIFGCMFAVVSATNEDPERTYSTTAWNGSDADAVTDDGVALAGHCQSRTHDVGLRYVIAKFNFAHVQTPFIVAAWILFVTLAKIGNRVSV